MKTLTKSTDAFKALGSMLLCALAILHAAPILLLLLLYPLAVLKVLASILATLAVIAEYRVMRYLLGEMRRQVQELKQMTEFL